MSRGPTLESPRRNFVWNAAFTPISMEKRTLRHQTPLLANKRLPKKFTLEPIGNPKQIQQEAYQHNKTIRKARFNSQEAEDKTNS